MNKKIRPFPHGDYVLVGKTEKIRKQMNKNFLVLSTIEEIKQDERYGHLGGRAAF